MDSRWDFPVAVAKVHHSAQMRKFKRKNRNYGRIIFKTVWFRVTKSEYTNNFQNVPFYQEATLSERCVYTMPIYSYRISCVFKSGKMFFE